MFHMSYDYQLNAKASTRHVQAKIEVLNAPTLTTDDIIGFNTKEAVTENAIEIGTAHAQALEVTCRTARHTFQNAVLRPFIGFDDEYCPLGVFYVSDIEYKDGEYTLTAYDKMAFLDVPYVPNLNFPNSAENVLNDIKTQYGLLLGTIPVLPPGPIITGIEEECTVRQMLGYLAGLVGTNAVFDREGKLTFRWFKQLKNVYGDVNDDNRVTSADITIINSELLGTVTDERKEAIMGRLVVGSARLGAVVKEKSILADVNEDGIVTSSDVSEIQAYINGTPYAHTKVGTVQGYSEQVDNNEIYLNNYTDKGTYEFTALISGTEEEPIEAGTGRAITFGNPYITQGILNTLCANMMPFEYTACEFDFIGNPTYEICDVLRVNDFDVPIMGQEFTFNGGFGAKVYSYGMTEEKANITAHVPTLLESIREVSTIANRVIEITNELNNSQGLLGGTYKELYGSDLDPSALSGLPIGWRVTSNSNPLQWWQMTYNGLAFTNDGGNSYKIGITNSGSILADNIVAGSVITNQFECTNLKLTGGSVHIVTAQADENLIELTSGWYKSTMSTKAIGIFNTEENNAIQIKNQSGALFVQFDDYYGVGQLSYDGMYGKLFLANVSGRTGGYLASENYVDNALSTSGFIKNNDSPTFGVVTATRTLATVGQNGNPQTVYLNPVSASVDPVYRATTTGALGTSSSLREYKCDIMDVEAEEIDPKRLYDLPVRQFHWRQDCNILNAEYEYDKWSIGFIAEEMDEFYPRATIYRDGKLASWSERNLVPAMLKLIQEQHAEIERLKEAVFND